MNPFSGNGVVSTEFKVPHEIGAVAWEERILSAILANPGFVEETREMV